MKITINDKKLAQAIADYVEVQLDEFSQEVLNKAKTPNVGDLADSLLEDKIFIKNVIRYIEDYINDVDLLSEAIAGVPCGKLDDTINLCHKISSALEDIGRTRNEEKDLEDLARQLRQAGYTVTRPKS